LRQYGFTVQMGDHEMIRASLGILVGVAVLAGSAAQADPPHHHWRHHHWHHWHHHHHGMMDHRKNDNPTVNGAPQ
jgi:Spy/CpxP family protein refolding chaperone